MTNSNDKFQKLANGCLNVNLTKFKNFRFTHERTDLIDFLQE